MFSNECWYGINGTFWSFYGVLISKHKPWWDFRCPMKMCLTEIHSLMGLSESCYESWFTDFLKWYASCRQEVDAQVNCDHSLLVKNCKFNTLALIFASIRCVLFICWSLFSSAWKEVIRIPFNRLSYPGRAINIDIGVGFYVLNQ